MKDWKYITARFIDEDRENVEALYWDGDQQIAINCSAVDEDAQYKELLNHTTLDQIHENTWVWQKEQGQFLKEIFTEIGRDQGYIVDFDHSAGSGETFKTLLNFIFKDFDEERDKEKLFLLKLEIFELPFVKDCKNRSKKTKIRKAKTVVEALEATIKIYDTKDS